MQNNQEETKETKAITVQVYGHVQGVFFRDWATTKAADLNIMGWVRNRVDHRVELHLEGSIEDVDFMVRLLKRGSPKSQVEGIMVDEAPFIDFKSFDVKDTV